MANPESTPSPLSGRKTYIPTLLRMAEPMRLYLLDHREAMMRNAQLDDEQRKVLNTLYQGLNDLNGKIGLPLFPEQYGSKSRPRTFDPQDEHVALHELWEQQKGRCFYCGCPLLRGVATRAQRQKKTWAPDEPRPFQVDHALPKSRGGKNRRVNYRLACVACNKHKGVLTEAEFMAVITHRNGGAPS